MGTRPLIGVETVPREPRLNDGERALAAAATAYRESERALTAVQNALQIHDAEAAREHTRLSGEISRAMAKRNDLQAKWAELKIRVGR